jgi:hypothetical protein
VTPIAFVCAWCERSRNGAGLWEPADPATPRGAAVTHGICPECLERETRAAEGGLLVLAEN